MKKYISLLLAVLFMASTVATFAAPFPDLPADHWATQAVTVLAEKGLVEGYPNGTFRGDRAATRYEVAMVVARMLAYLEKTQPQVSKEDLDTLRKLVDEFRNELDAQGVRLKNVEDLLAALDRRVSELERVKWAGGFETRYVTGQLKSCAGCTVTPFQFNGTAIGERTPSGDQNGIWNNTDLHLASREKPADEVEGYPFDRAYTAVPLASGSALTEQGYLRVEAKLTDDYKAGGVMNLYNNVGATNNGYIYGVTPGTLANPFQAGTPSIFSTLNRSVNLNQIYVANQKENLNVAVGDWRPAYIPSHLLQGLPNVGVFGPDYLPFQGGQVYGQMGGTALNGLNYEAVAGRLSVANTTNYQNIVYGGALGYEWKNLTSLFPTVNLTGSYVHAMNDIATLAAGTTGGVPNPGQWASPSSPLGPASLNSGNGVGPQAESLWGADLKVNLGDFAKMVSVFGKYGNSKYNAAVGASTTVSSVSGNLASGGANINEGGRLSGGGEYLWVQPSYDPFVAEIPIPATSFTGPTLFYGFPYPVSYGPPFTGYIGNGNLTNGSGNIYYNLHDTREYPQNRRGFRVWTNWRFNDNGHLGAKYESLRQVQISTPQAELTPGFTEPIFYTQQTYPNTTGGTITQGSAFGTTGTVMPGSIKTYQIFGDYTFLSKAFTLDGLYVNNQIRRFAGDANNIDLLMNWWRGGLTYHPDAKWSLMGGYSQFKSGGAGMYLQPGGNTFGVAINSTRINGTTGPVVAANNTTPPNMRFKQYGPYIGANFAFANNAAAWIMYQGANLKDNNISGVAGFTGSTVQSGLRFIF